MLLNVQKNNNKFKSFDSFEKKKNELLINGQLYKKKLLKIQKLILFIY